MDRHLQAWAATIAHPFSAVFTSPNEMAGLEGVSLHLLELVGTPPARGAGTPPLALNLRYLITTWAADGPTAHRLLGELTFAAMEDPDFEVEPAPAAPALWQAFGIAPRPALLLRLAVTRLRPERSAPLVRKPLAVQLAGMQPLQGRLLGPGQVPVPAATVTLPSLQLTTRTDFQGRFRFPSVPRDPPPTELRINARGRTVTVPLPTPLPTPLLLELNETQI